MINNSTKNGAGSHYSSCLLLNTLNVCITGPAATSGLSIVACDWSVHMQVGGNQLQFHMFQSCVGFDAVHQNPPPSDISAGWVQLTTCILIFSSADTALVWRKWTRIFAKVMQCCDHILSDHFFVFVFRKWLINSCSVLFLYLWLIKSSSSGLDLHLSFLRIGAQISSLRLEESKAKKKKREREQMISIPLGSALWFWSIVCSTPNQWNQLMAY